MRRNFEMRNCKTPRPAGWRKQGVDFDVDGRKSTLQELLQLGGFFPIAKISDRLPFALSTLRAWARKGPFTDCFVQSHAVTGCEPTATLINLDRFDGRFQALAQQASEEDEQRYLAEIRSFLGRAGNLAG